MTDSFPDLPTYNLLTVSTQIQVLTEMLVKSFISKSFLGVMVVCGLKTLIWAAAVVFHNMVEALAQKCDVDQCSFYLLGCRLTLINVLWWRINLSTIRALFGGLYFKLFHLLCTRYIVLVANGRSLFALCDMSGTLLYITTYHKRTHGNDKVCTFSGGVTTLSLCHPLTFIK